MSVGESVQNEPGAVPVNTAEDDVDVLDGAQRLGGVERRVDLIDTGAKPDVTQVCTESPPTALR
jgi:hypothetical protein